MEPAATGSMFYHNMPAYYAGRNLPRSARQSLMYTSEGLYFFLDTRIVDLERHDEALSSGCRSNSKDCDGASAFTLSPHTFTLSPHTIFFYFLINNFSLGTTYLEVLRQRLHIILLVEVFGVHGGPHL